MLAEESLHKFAFVLIDVRRNTLSHLNTQSEGLEFHYKKCVCVCVCVCACVRACVCVLKCTKLNTRTERLHVGQIMCSLS